VMIIGTGDSGKTTLFKQLRVIYKGFALADIARYRTVLASNTIESMQLLLTTYGDMKSTSLSDDQVLESPSSFNMRSKVVRDVMKSERLDSQVAKAIEYLWTIPEVKAIYNQRETLKLNIPWAAPHYFENATTWINQDIALTTKDIIYAKINTTGISVLDFDVGNIKFELIDVGGNRSERWKWMCCRDTLDVIVFVVALDGYNLVLEEDGKTNRMIESIRLFHDLSTHAQFSGHPWVLLLNKKDLFEKKLPKVPLNTIFDDIDKYDGCDADMALLHIQSKFEENFGGEPSKLFCFSCCALNTESCEDIFTSMKENLFEK